MKQDVSSWGIQEAHRIKSICILLENDEAILEYLFGRKASPKLRQSPEELKKSSLGFSHDQQLLIDGALDLWSESGNLRLGECLATWDYSILIRLIRAVCHLKEIQQETIYALMKDFLG